MKKKEEVHVEETPEVVEQPIEQTPVLDLDALEEADRQEWLADKAAEQTADGLVVSDDFRSQSDPNQTATPEQAPTESAEPSNVVSAEETVAPVEQVRLLHLLQKKGKGWQEMADQDADEMQALVERGWLVTRDGLYKLTRLGRKVYMRQRKQVVQGQRVRQFRTFA